MRYNPYKIPDAFKIEGRELPTEGFFDENGRFIPARAGEEVESFEPAVDRAVADRLAEEDGEGFIPYTLKLKPDSRYNVAWGALPEIDRLWWAIRGAGPLIRTKQKHQKRAALECSNDSKRGFQYIKREYLEDDHLYAFNSPSQEKRDFRLKMLRKIFTDHVPFKTTKEQLLYIIWLLTTDPKK